MPKFTSTNRQKPSELRLCEFKQCYNFKLEIKTGFKFTIKTF